MMSLVLYDFNHKWNMPTKLINSPTIHKNPFSLSRVATLRKRYDNDKNVSFQLRVVTAPKVFFFIFLFFYLLKDENINTIVISATVYLTPDEVIPYTE